MKEQSQSATQHAAKNAGGAAGSAGRQASVLREYYNITKPGIIKGNLITATAGFFLASQGIFDWWLLVVMLAGLALVIASGCVLNNVMDRKLDAKMARTKKRALVTGAVSVNAAAIYGSVLGIAGALILYFGANWLTAALAAAGWFFYVVVYGFVKRKTPLSTAIGSISGAMPPVVGYTAVSDKLDGAALILFLILVFWQMPHFYAIGIYRRKEYKAAGLPILTIKSEVKKVKAQILGFMVLFGIAAALLATLEYASIWYWLAALGISGYWLWVGVNEFQGSASEAWARKVFKSSLIVLLLLCVAIAADSVLAGV